jgi:hypothetical protein
VFFPYRVLTALAAASMLAACQGGAITAPALPGSTSTDSAARAAQSAARSTAGHKAKTPEIAAAPASLEFTAGQAAAGTPQTVTITSKSDGRFTVSIAGTGNCPTVSPARLAARRVDEDGDRDRDRRDAKAGVITVTPAGAGPATCTITVSSAGEGDGDRDNDRDNDRDKRGEHGEHHADASDTLTIPVVVDAPASPAPTPTPTPTPTPCPGRVC